MIVLVDIKTGLVTQVAPYATRVNRNHPEMDAYYSQFHIVVLDDDSNEAKNLKEGWAYDVVSGSFSEPAAVRAQRLDDANEPARRAIAQGLISELNSLSQPGAQLTSAELSDAVRVLARVCLYLLKKDLTVLRAPPQRSIR